MHPINYHERTQNKYMYIIERFIAKNKLFNFDTFLTGETQNVFQFCNPSSIHSCLNWFEDKDSSPDYILIENTLNKAHLVLLDNKVRVLCLLYNSSHDCERFFPIFEYPRKGINHLIFTSSYIVFTKLDI